jgi:hypothetical protein
MNEPTPRPERDERSRHDSGREPQPDHAAHAQDAADQAERVEHHSRQAEDDQGIGGHDSVAAP